MMDERRPFLSEPSSAPVVEVHGLVKDFGKLRAVDDVSFDVRRGEILGLLGPNGAGKTTVIHMLLGLTTPTAGTIRIFGFDLAHHREEILERTNFSSSYVSLPYSLTIRECLLVFAGLYHVRRPKARIKELLETFEMPELGRKQVRHLSTGQMSRLNLAKAFINDPELLLLDEPTASLDPDIADKTRTLLVQVARERKVSILYTSHNMLEMEQISDRLVFLHKGKVIATGKPADVVSAFAGENLEAVFLKIAREKKP